MVKELIVVKVPRSDEILDKKISFSPLHNLHLDLIEIKKKLKKGLPLVFVNKVPPKQSPPKESQKKEQKAVAENPPKEIEIEIPSKDEDEENEEELPEDEEEDIGENENDEEEGDMLKELGEDENEKEDVKESEPSKDEEPPEKEEDPHEGMTPEQIEQQEKEEYIWRFKILKKQYKNRNIPAYNEHDDLNQMKSEYKTILREIHLENNIDSYRSYLIGGFVAMEYVFANLLGVNLSGFTAQQMLIMDKYDVMLIELGEKQYSSWSMNAPVEVKLILFVLWQAVIFYIAKLLGDKGASSILAVFAGITGQPQQTQQNKPENQEPVKKMRGPSIKVSDIKRGEQK